MAEGVGVEPTRHILCASTDLKSARLTRERFPSNFMVTTNSVKVKFLIKTSFK